MGKTRPRWVDKPEFAWTPEPPLRLERHASGEFAPEPGRPGSADAIPGSPSPGPRNRSLRTSPMLQRLALALAQGVILAILLHARAGHDLPGNGGVTAGLILALAFAPLLAIEGLGHIPARALLIWTGSAALLLFALGFYLHWRAGEEIAASGLAQIVMAGAILFVGQSLMLAHGGRQAANYRAIYRASWGLAVQLVFTMLCAASLWILGVIFPAAWPVMPVAMTIAVALIAQFPDVGALGRIANRLTLVLTALLPVLILLSLSVIILWSLARWLPPLTISASLAALTILGINGSYRDGRWRTGWRRQFEFAGAIVLPPQVVLAGMALYARTSMFGFTANRVMALALVLLLSAYALAYAAAALISLGGGRAMERLETGNRVMAFVVIAIFAAMNTPLADPARLAVAEQRWRLSHGVVAPDKFDYAWLRRSGLRFAHEPPAAPALKPSVAP